VPHLFRIIVRCGVVLPKNCRIFGVSYGGNGKSDFVKGDAGELAGAVGMKTFFGFVGPEFVEGGVGGVPFTPGRATGFPGWPTRGIM